ncbi:hypothetical protein [uncultured Parabacteroides sp.]|uniref:hypothetical protein n=1 Tax=uncultured Parabacteroides sp. TaxID=512312 RepID=UPI00258A27B5|nr:hypothetical protein [uncultured Parabacteroides sp.]
MKNKLLVSVLFASVLFSQADAINQIRPSVNYYQEGDVVSRTYFETDKPTVTTDVNGCEWLLTVDKRAVENDNTAQDYVFTWELKRGVAKNVSFSVNFQFDRWTPDNYVFVPSIVYDGNRFAVKDINYPPFWYDKNEWRLDMPTTTTVQPTLNEKGGQSRIDLTSGNASTPLMAFFSQRDQRAWMVQTNQGNNLGDYGLSIEEKKNQGEAVFSIQAPVVRPGNRADFPATVSVGEKVIVSCRTYDFKASRLNDMMDRFVEVRKTFNPATRNDVLPFSHAWTLLDDLYQNRRWDERIEMYWLSDVQEHASWNFIWQLGWVGGGQSTLPLLLQGTDQGKERAMRNLDVIYSKTQTKSGFFYAYGDGKEFYGFGYSAPLEHNVTMVRSQGDWLYMAQRQINLLKSRGEQVKSSWLEGTKKQAEAFARLWDKYGQFGQFVDVETGDLCIGGSTAGGIVPAGLVLASKLYDNPRYLDIARQAARDYYTNYVAKGYTTGGPGEILSTPDSESAFGLFESYMVLYEYTGEKEWLKYASELLPICASWTVSYDFIFPESSPLGKIGAHSCGSVWASVANKHAAPGICTWSGDCLLKYYRATNDERALELLTDIAHNLPQYISRKECPVGNMPSGGVCERVNLSDWEGKDQVGGSIFGSCSWCEVAAMLTVTELPSLYVQSDKQVVAVFDHLKVNKKQAGNGRMILEVTNPTSYPADVKIYSETSGEARKNPLLISSDRLQVVRLNPGESKEINI